MRKTTINTTFAAALFTLTATAASFAEVDTVGETVIHGHAVQVEHVQYERGELASQKGRESLERRLQNAAKRVCGSQNLRIVGSLSQVERNRACYEAAVADAFSQLGATQVAVRD